MQNKIQLPPRETYSLKKALEYINNIGGSTHDMDYLLHHIRLGKLKTVIKPNFFEGEGSVFLPIIDDDNIEHKLYLYDIEVTYHIKNSKNNQGLISYRGIWGRFSFFCMDKPSVKRNVSRYIPTEIKWNIINKKRTKKLIVKLADYSLGGYIYIPNFYFYKKEDLIIEENEITFYPRDRFYSATDNNDVEISFKLRDDLKTPFINVPKFSISLDEMEILHKDLIEFLGVKNNSNSVKDKPVELKEDTNNYQEKNIKGKSETSYLNIIQALKDELLASGTFKNQSELIAFLSSKYAGYTGLTESNLRDKFAKANQIK